MNRDHIVTATTAYANSLGLLITTPVLDWAGTISTFNVLNRSYEQLAQMFLNMGFVQMYHCKEQPNNSSGFILQASFMTPDNNRIDILWGTTPRVALNNGNWYFGSMRLYERASIRKAMKQHGFRAIEAF